MDRLKIWQYLMNFRIGEIVASIYITTPNGDEASEQEIQSLVDLGYIIHVGNVEPPGIPYNQYMITPAGKAFRDK